LSKPFYLEKNGGRAGYKEREGTSEGVITAGNSSPLNAGATTCLMMEAEEAKKRGLEPLAKIVSIGWAGVDPSVMGRGPVPATEMALKHAGLTADDMDYWEINEAFCIVALNCMKHFNIPEEKVNIMGGSTAIGHPLGATMIRLPGTLARILKDKKAKYGMANACVGGGQGVATLIENIDA
jgi:acetyl-CoA C-acetyltransferase